MLTITPEPQAGFFTVSDESFIAKAKVNDTPSPDWGLLGGRIIKLDIRETNVGYYHETRVFNYDRGFDFDDLSIEGRRFLAAVVNYFDGVRQPAQGA